MCQPLVSDRWSAFLPYTSDRRSVKNPDQLSVVKWAGPRGAKILAPTFWPNGAKTFIAPTTPKSPPRPPLIVNPKSPNPSTSAALSSGQPLRRNIFLPPHTLKLSWPLEVLSPLRWSTHPASTTCPTRSHLVVNREISVPKPSPLLPTSSCNPWGFSYSHYLVRILDPSDSRLCGGGATILLPGRQCPTTAVAFSADPIIIKCATNMDKSWMNAPRHTEEYIQGLARFLGYAFAKSSVENKILCPCKNCVNSYLERRKNSS
nr:uncharacterized protein LOC127335681 [Lolium perenne]